MAKKSALKTIHVIATLILFSHSMAFLHDMNSNNFINMLDQNLLTNGYPASFVPGTPISHLMSTSSMFSPNMNNFVPSVPGQTSQLFGTNRWMPDMAGTYANVGTSLRPHVPGVMSQSSGSFFPGIPNIPSGGNNAWVSGSMYPFVNDVNTNRQGFGNTNNGQGLGFNGQGLGLNGATAAGANGMFSDLTIYPSLNSFQNEARSNQNPGFSDFAMSSSSGAYLSNGNNQFLQGRQWFLDPSQSNGVSQGLNSALDSAKQGLNTMVTGFKQSLSTVMNGIQHSLDSVVVPKLAEEVQNAVSQSSSTTESCQTKGCHPGNVCTYTDGYVCPDYIPFLQCQCKLGCRHGSLFIPYGEERSVDQCGNSCSCLDPYGSSQCSSKPCVL